MKNNNKLIGRVASKIFACHHDGKLSGFTKVKYTKKLEKDYEELKNQAFDLLVEYLDVDALSLDDIKEELEDIKKKMLDNWYEASELM